MFTTSGDGYAHQQNASWDTAHDAPAGSSSVFLTPTALTGTAKTDGDYSIYRSFLPFVTSPLPDDATITSASLNVFAHAKKNGDNDGDDYVTVVQTSQSSATRVILDDYDQAGDINNPVEGIDVGERKDLSSIHIGDYVVFNLNATGLSWISTTGITKLGLREGHDTIDSAITPTPPIAPMVNNILTIRTSEYPNTSFDPYLTVTYTQTTESTTTTTTNAVTYSYDHAGHRVSKTSDSGTTYYPTSDYSVEGSTTTVYVSDSSRLVASVKDDGSTTTTQTIHTNHLGSTSVVTDEDGIMVELMDYHPYGTERISWSSSSSDGEAESKKTYIGEYSDDESGLSYLNARYYDPERGQFLSQDPVSLNIGDKRFYKFIDASYQGEKFKEKGILWSYLSSPQNLNKYSYARNNPVNRIDSTGNLDKKTNGATEEQIKAFDDALAQLQVEVVNSQEIQDYFKAFGVDINEALKDNGRGVDVYIGRENESGYDSKGNYDRLWNNIDIYNDALTDQDNIQHTLMHEMGHWANDVGKWWGNLNPDISSFGSVSTKLDEYSNSIRNFWLWRAIDGDYGFGSEIIMFGEIR